MTDMRQPPIFIFVGKLEKVSQHHFDNKLKRKNSLRIKSFNFQAGGILTSALFVL
jgi:hypothetical protein